MFYKFLIKTAAAVGAMAFLLSNAAAGPSKIVRDWSVYCSDTLICSLATIPQSNSLYSFEFQREPAANAPLRLRISVDGNLKPNSSLSIFVPSVLEGYSLAVSTSKMRDGYIYFSDPTLGSLLIPAMLKGQKAIVVFETEKGSQRAELSLSGSSASTLYLDEVQNRVDKTDALVAKGSGAPTGKVTRAQELKSTKDLPQAVAQIWRGHPEECAGFDDQDLIAQFGGIAIKLQSPSKGNIYVIPCGGPGAYNLNYAGFIFDAENKAARSLSFPTMSNLGPTVTTSIINMSWDDDKGQLSSYYKGRGLGDCGVASVWRWDGNGVYGNFILVEERAKDDCDGVDDEWPLVWPQQ